MPPPWPAPSTLPFLMSRLRKWMRPPVGAVIVNTGACAPAPLSRVWVASGVACVQSA
jgi:hypothetical protein